MTFLLLVAMVLALAYGIYEDRRGNEVPIQRVGYGFLGVIGILFAATLVG